MAKYQVNGTALDDAVKAIKATGGKAAKNFNNVEVRDMGNTGFNVGDKFQIDATQKYVRNVRGNNANLLLVIMSDGSVKELFLSMMTRSVVIYNGDERTEETDEAGGSAVARWKQYRIAEDSVKALDGCTIEVKSRRVVHTKTMINGSRQERDQVIYDFDIIAEKEEEQAPGAENAANASGAANAENAGS